jgi:hypothetical protein
MAPIIKNLDIKNSACNLKFFDAKDLKQAHNLFS